MVIQIEKGENPGPQYYQCPFCGVQIFQNTRFCYHCGQPLHEGQALDVNVQIQPPPYPKKQASFSIGTPSDFDDSTKDNPFVSPPLPSPGDHVLFSTINASELGRKIISAWKYYSIFWNITFGTIILFILFMITLAATDRLPENETNLLISYGYLVFVVIILVTGLCAFVKGLVLLHRLWQVVPPEMAKTTPNRAVGFLFIPLFNLYWMFIAYYQLAKTYRVLTKLAGRETNHEILAVFRNVIQLVPNLNTSFGPILTMTLLYQLYKDALFVLENYQTMAEENNLNYPFDPNGNANKAEYSLVIPTNTSVMAIAAGYLGLFSVLVFPAPFAILFGILALRKLKQNPGLFGYGRAWFGIIMGSLITFFVAVFIVIGLLA